MSNMGNLPRHSRTVSATEAAKNFGSILTEVRERGAEYVVEHRGTAVARVGPVRERGFTVREFFDLVAHRPWPPLDEECLRAIEEGIEIWNREEVPRSPWER
jgi:antitoxin (DNA-binding transcriptional repressor) of toxin-antitoxin stability system